MAEFFRKFPNTYISSALIGFEGLASYGPMFTGIYKKFKFFFCFSRVFYITLFLVKLNLNNQSKKKA